MENEKTTESPLLHERLLDAINGIRSSSSEGWGIEALRDAVGSKCYMTWQGDLLHCVAVIAEEIESDYIPRTEHEAKLRECADRVNDHNPHRGIAAWACINDMPLTSGQSITEWLDKWFIKRPLFEDGQPVQFGEQVGCNDLYMEHPVDTFAFSDDGSVELRGDGNSMWYCRGERVARPAPKVLDADGVETNVGDKGFMSFGKFKPVTIKAVYPSFTWRSLPYPCVEYEEGGWDKAANFTHKEPDSLEKLRDYVLEQERQESSSARDTYHEIAGRITALMERGA